MDFAQSEATPEKNGVEQRPAGTVAVWFGWVLFVLLAYLFSTGPIVHVQGQKHRYYESVSMPVFCEPALYLYWHTPLKRPLGFYWHLWDPIDFDKTGDWILYIIPD